MVHITDELLRVIVTDVLVGAGAPHADAQQIAESLVLNNLVGHDSHGVRAVSGYVEALENGTLNPHGKLTVVRESATSALLDVDNGFGVVAMRRATDLALSKARTHDLGMVTLRNSSHTGRFGEYVVRIAEAGFMGLVFGTGAKPGGTVGHL